MAGYLVRTFMAISTPSPRIRSWQHGPPAQRERVNVAGGSAVQETIAAAQANQVVLGLVLVRDWLEAAQC